jgi:hypothetical protein
MNNYFFIALSLLLPIWNIPHTIALRYLCLVILLLTVVFSRINWKFFFKSNELLLLLFLYLLIQLFFFSKDFHLAVHNFNSEWLKFILFAFAGVGCGYILHVKKLPKLNLYFGFLFAIPLIIHLILSLWVAFEIGHIPRAYWGINKTHGDLAYTALHATVFLTIFYLLDAKTCTQKYLCLAILSTCILSNIIASSRGGTVFVFLSITTVLCLNIFVHKQSPRTSKNLMSHTFCMVVLILGVYKIVEKLDFHRWSGTISRLEMGFKGDALKINCEGIEILENTLRNEGVVITPEILRNLDSVKYTDGARIMAARTAIQLISQHLMGIDQSRQGYEKALEQACGKAAKIQLSNAHNGWLDTALGIGVIGAVLYFLVLCSFFIQGLRASFKKSKEIVSYGVALCSLSFLWIVRSIFDSAQRDQMMEMQIFTMCLLSSLILYKNQATTNLD